MKNLKGAFIAVVALVMAGASQAADKDAGTVTSNIINMQIAARPAALGGAFTAVEGDINSFYKNPAGMGFIRKSEVYASRFNGNGELTANTLSFAIPLGDVNTSNVRQLGVLAVGLSNMNYGKTDVFLADGSRAGDFDASDKMLSVGWGKSFGGRAALGVTSHLYRVEIFGKADSGTVADAGALLKAVPGVLNLGAAVRNVGGGISYDGSSSDVPTTYSVGAALYPLGTPVVMLTADVEKPRDASSAIKGGIEWNPVTPLVLRAGYDSVYDAGSGISLGMGIVLLDLEVGFFPVDRVTLDYAFTPNEDLDYAHRIALSFRIGTQ